MSAHLHFDNTAMEDAIEEHQEGPKPPPPADGYVGDEPWDDDGPFPCHRCNGKGELLVCIDDICHGLGECIHGDGMVTCPDCKGEGEIEPT